MKQKQRKAVFWTVVAILVVIYVVFLLRLVWPVWWAIPLGVGMAGTAGFIGWLLFKFKEWASKPDPEQPKTA